MSQAARLAAWLEQDAPAGPAYALDLSGSGAIIEANPVWCSSWYGCDLPAFAAAVAAAQGADVPEDHLWAPDQALVLRARRLGPLPMDRTGAGPADLIRIGDFVMAAAHVLGMADSVVYGVVDRRAVLRNEYGEVSLRPSACLSRLPVLRAYPSVVAAYVARRELQLELRLLALTGSFPNGSVFSVGARIGRGFRTLGMFDDFGQALTAACDRELFPTGQGAIDLLTAMPVFTSAVQFRDAGRPGIPLLDWQGLNAEFFVLGHFDVASKISAVQETAQDRRDAGAASADRSGALISAA